MSTKYLREADWPGWAWVGLSILLTPQLAALVAGVLNNNGPDTAVGWYAMIGALTLLFNFGTMITTVMYRIVDEEWPWQ